MPKKVKFVDEQPVVRNGRTPVVETVVVQKHTGQLYPNSEFTTWESCGEVFEPSHVSLVQFATFVRQFVKLARRSTGYLRITVSIEWAKKKGKL